MDVTSNKSFLRSSPGEEEIDRLRAELEWHKNVIWRLKAALEPFAHPDLYERIGGQMYSDSPVYGRNKATLYIHDFERAAHVLEVIKGDNHESD